MDSWLTMVVDRLWFRLLLLNAFPLPFPFPEVLPPSAAVSAPLIPPPLGDLANFRAWVSLISSKVALQLVELALCAPGSLPKCRLCLPPPSLWPDEEPPLMEEPLVVLVPLDKELSDISELGRRMLPFPGSECRSLGATQRSSRKRL